MNKVLFCILIFSAFLASLFIPIKKTIKKDNQFFLNQEIKKILSEKGFRLRQEKEDPNLYIKSQMRICFSSGGKDSCYKNLATILFNQFYLSEILDLIQKNEEDEAVFSRCHELTHYLTRLAYSKEQSITKVYDQCTSVCHGGCYHGAIEQYLSDKKLTPGVDNERISQEIPKVCGIKSEYKIPLLYDECTHGIGHGTMYITDGDLIASLSMCDLLDNQRDKESCYSGAFMENSSSSTNLDHPSKFIRADDPMYPCNILDKRYLNLCYRYQSSHFAIITQSNWQEVSKLCLKVPDEYRLYCFLTIGSNQVGFTQDLKTILNNCNLMPSEYQKYCFEGAVDAMAIRYRDDISWGVNFCSQIPPQFQKGCFKQYGSSISTWSADPSSKINLCSNIENIQFALWCRGDR